MPSLGLTGEAVRLPRVTSCVDAIGPSFLSYFSLLLRSVPSFENTVLDRVVGHQGPLALSSSFA